jgi:hypothetical protein
MEIARWVVKLEAVGVDPEYRAVKEVGASLLGKLSSYSPEPHTVGCTDNLKRIVS